MLFFCIREGSVIAATTPIMPKVINTSANVKPDLIVLLPAALNGSKPVPIPVKELKLLCPPPEKSCLYCVFHNLISFFSCNIDFCFLFKKKYLFSQTCSLSVHAIVSKTYIFSYSSICVFLSNYKTFFGHAPALLLLSPQKVL